VNLDDLDAFVGEWSMSSSFGSGGARTTFEWLTDRRFLIQRWEVDHPAAPDGIAVIGLDADDRLLQHYFDSRGVARIYEMTFDGETWTLERRGEAPDFSQRFTATFTDDDTIIGAWERSDDGVAWTHDFDLGYARVR